MTKTITFNLSTSSLNNAVKSLQSMQSSLKNTEKEFIRLSTQWLKAKASENITKNYPDFVSDFTTLITGNMGILITTDEQQAYIEFGTGIIGKQNSHELAEENSWEYDVNNHGTKGWSFTHGFDDKLDVKESNIISRNRKSNHSGMWERIRTKGVEAERFMFNAYVEFFYRGVYKVIFKQALTNTQ